MSQSNHVSLRVEPYLCDTKLISDSIYKEKQGKTLDFHKLGSANAVVARSSSNNERFSAGLEVISLYHAVSRPGFAIPEDRAEEHATAQATPVKGYKTVCKVAEWNVVPELEGFRNQHQQHLQGIYRPDEFTKLPVGISPVSSESNAYAILAYTHFDCCNAVLRSIGSPASIRFSNSKLYTSNVGIEIADFQNDTLQREWKPMQLNSSCV